MEGWIAKGHFYRIPSVMLRQLEISVAAVTSARDLTEAHQALTLPWIRCLNRDSALSPWVDWSCCRRFSHWLPESRWEKCNGAQTLEDASNCGPPRGVKVPKSEPTRNVAAFVVWGDSQKRMVSNCFASSPPPPPPPTARQTRACYSFPNLLQFDGQGYVTAHSFLPPAAQWMGVCDTQCLFVCFPLP